MNAQQMFNKVAKHLLTQNKKSLLPASVDRCAYRGENGLKCAVGCLIPDSVYVPQMEGRTIGSILASFPILSSFIPDEGLAFRLQLIHDQISPDRWKTELECVAKDYKLSSNILQTL